ncbi:AraC family transcriptional regulator [Actinocrispum sp. NPDC049592]|uniref:AraC family transcriptional regulator n=1 Tax=Actinocrispum sp. NPDC049592 TaxID=3154835 RepID=UPI00343CA1AA
MAELGVADTNGILALPWITPERTSAGLGWEHVYVSKQHEIPFQSSFRAAPTHQLILHLAGPVAVRRGSAAPRRVQAGGLFLQPAHGELNVELCGELDTLHVYLSDKALDDDVRLAEELGSNDPLLEQLALALDSTARDWQPSARTYVDQLTNLMATQLARHHSAGRKAADSRQTGLSEQQFARVRELLCDRIAEPIPLADMARVAGLSVSQFARQFKVTAGAAPHRFLLRMRVKHAERLLRTSTLPIAEVAVRCGFSHQEHLTRVMRAQLGTTPGAVRNS